MKILSIGTDSSVLNKKSSLAGRVVEYGNLVDKYTIIVPASENSKASLSDQVQIYGVGASWKFFVLFKIHHLAQLLIKKYKYDIITVQDQYYLALVGWLLVKKFKIGLEIQVHGFEKFGGLRKLIAKFVIPRAQAVRTVSQRAKKQLVSEFGVRQERITVVPIFVDTGNLKFEIRNLEKGKRDNFVFLTVGRLVLVKNIGLQIRAMAEIIETHGNASVQLENKNIELWVVGDGPERKKLEVIAAIAGSRKSGRSKKLEVNNRIKFFGWQDSLEKFYSQADVFLLTSDYEGWGMVVIEAAARGLPIIMTDVGCANEIIKDEQSGLVVPVGSLSKLKEAMIKLIEDRELRKKLGERARQAILSLPDKEETLKLYKESWEKAILK